MSYGRVLLAASLLALTFIAHGPVSGAPAPGAITIDLSPADLGWTAVDGGYRATLPDAPSAGEPGAWDIPLLPLTVLPPAGTRLASVWVQAATTARVEPPGSVAVVAGASAGSSGRMPQEDLAQVAPGGYLRGTRVDGVSLAPLRRLSDGSWEMVTRVTLGLSFEVDDAQGVLRPLRGPAGVRREELRGRVFDLDGGNAAVRPAASEPAAAAGAAFEPLFNPSLDGSPVAYVIVTTEAQAEEYQRLADWKTRQGTLAVVRTVEWIRENYPEGADLPERIRDFIRDAVAHWGTEWVLLGGDSPIVPIRLGRTTYYTGEVIPTDLYYQCLDGNWNRDGDLDFGEGWPKDDADLLPDVWVGRFPSQDATDARIVVDKVLTYEIAPPVDDDYPASALLLAEVLAPQNWRPGDTALFDGGDLSEETAAYLPQGFKVKRLYENYAAFEGAEVETLTAVLDEINRGYGFIHHVGHGYHNNMAVGRGGHSIVIAHADALHNAQRPSVLYAINCTSSAIDFDCISEHFLFNPAGGSLAAVGATRYDFPGTSHLYDLEFCELVFSPEPDPTGGASRLGKAAALSKVPFIPISVNDNSNRWTQFTLIYLGDPHMRLWTRKPAALAVTHPASVAGGERAIQLTVRQDGEPVENARVTLFKEGETFATALTDASGEATLTARPTTGGILQVTAVAEGCLPYLADVQVTAPTTAYPVLAGVSVDDSAFTPANNNGRLEAGERARVEFLVQNRGVATLSGLSLNCSVEGDALTLTPISPGGPATLAPGAEAIYPFEALAASAAGDLTSARVILVVGADQGSWTLPAVVQIGAPRLGIHELVLQEMEGDGDGTWESGETVGLSPRLINLGGGGTLDLTGSLSFAEEQGATLLDDAASFGPIPVGGVGSALEEPAFRLRLGAGTTLPRVRLVVRDGAADRLDMVLDLRKPAAPASGIARGSEASITVTWTASTDVDIARYVVYRGLDPAGPFERVSGFEENPFIFFVDAPLPGLSVRYYRVAAQDSSGNLSAEGAVIRGTAGLPLVVGFPMAAELGTQASPLVVDLDGDGLVDGVTGREQIYAFHGDGDEVRDGDLDARTLGVWTKRPTVKEGYWASPAVADLDGDGRLELVAVSKAEGEIAVWDSFGNMLPGWPRNAWTGQVPRLSTPVLADVTGDGLPEIFFQGVKGLWGFDRFGEELRDGDDDPATHGIFYESEGVYSYGSVGAADVDGDGRDELAFGVRFDGTPDPTINMGRMYLLDDDGEPFPGWPITVRGGITSSPAIADLNGDGKLDVIMTTGSDSLEVRGLDGTSLPGWPRFTYVQNQDLMPSPAVADLDGDGALDVASVSGNGTANLWRADGTYFPGFPVDFPNELGKLMASRGSVSLANLDGDDALEMVWGNRTGWIFALNVDGSSVEGFPLKTDTPMDGGVLVADLDGDGFNEVVVSGFDRPIYAFRSPGHVVANPGWPMFRHDPRRTGCVTAPLREAVEPRLALGLLQGPQLPEALSILVVATKELASPVAVTLDGSPLAVSVADAQRRFYRSGAFLTAGSHQIVATGTARDGRTARVERGVDLLDAPQTRGWMEARLAGVSLWVGGTDGWPDHLLVQRAPEQALPEEGVPQGDGLRVQVGRAGAAAPAGTQIRFAVGDSWTGARISWWDGSAWKGLPLTAWSAGTATVAAPGFGWYLLTPAATSEVVPRPALALGSAAPNPFTGSARIAFALSAEGRVRADVFDVQGRRIRALADRVFPAGEHGLEWEGGDDSGRPAPAGIYFIRVTVGEERATRRVVRLGGGGER